jgi:hypothetical protein
MKSRFLRIGAVSLGLLLAANLAIADPLPEWLPGSTVVAEAGPMMSPTGVTAMMLEANSANVTVSGDTVTFMNGSMTMMDMWEWSWMSITLERDPFISFVGGFQNISGMAQDFILSTSTPIAPALLTSLIGGSTLLGLGDSCYPQPSCSPDGLGGLFNDSSANPAYTGTIDGAAALNMLTSPSLNLVPLFAGDTTQSVSQSLGLPGPTIPGPAVNSTIGITHRFNLSDGDQMTFNSSFWVVVPEPGTFALLAAGLGGLALFGRLRRI